MKIAFFQLAFALVFLGLAGCTTTPAKLKPVSPKADTAVVVPEKAKTDEPQNAPAPISAASAEVKLGGLPPGEFAILVESLPAGGTVVVNGIPVGRAPQRIVLPGSSHGFFRDDVSLKVRFIAQDATRTSQTVEELLTPLDRIPAIVRFTPSGATRVAR
ncbi:MAG TPA: hypothetical protein VFT72_11990 [Opitutaceae bacterium]|nr:hypothetical protein [Opitutaceae bacterium]